MKQLLAVAVMGRDRPGIVAEVSGRLFRLGCNIEDVVTSQLSGHFALMLICAGPAGLSADAVRRDMTALPADLHVAAWDVDERPVPARSTHVLNVYGPDRPGIVHRVASALAERGVNITDMTCRLDSRQSSLYALTLEIQLPDDVSPAELETALRGSVSALDLELTMAPIQVEVL
jgi:glycine cleavage system transcriptional repressor